MAQQFQVGYRQPLIVAVAALCWLGVAGVACANAVTAEHRFTESASGTYPGGAEPTAGLTFSAGVLYGTTSRGGSTEINGYGGGVAFKLEKSGTSYVETLLHAFTGTTDGIFPGNGNLLVADGHVYGTTAGWIEEINEGIAGCGAKQNISCDTVFELSPSGKKWTWSLVHRFAGGADGYDPAGGLIMNKAGALFGTTMFGGNKGCGAQQPPPMTGCGTVFKLARSGSTWVKTVLHTFTGGADGSVPGAALLADPSGNGVLYGTASSGGKLSNSGNICNFNASCGVIFMLTPTAKAPWKETVLYSFKGAADGAIPLAALVLRDGVLYGTTSGGGDYQGYGCLAYGGGSVFAFTIKTKQFRTLYDFKCGSDGGVPLGNVALDPAGNVYGTTSTLGEDYHSVQCDTNYGCGAVFKLAHRTATPWVETHLVNFVAGANGGQSEAGLTIENGILWGTTRLGGNSKCQIDPFTAGCGVVFSLAP